MADEDPNTKSINIDGLDTSTVHHLIQAAYKAGYDQINIAFKDKNLIDFKTGEIETVYDTVDSTIGRLFGMHISFESESSILLEYKQAGNFSDVQRVLDDIFSTLVLLSENVFIKSKEDKSILEKTKEKHDLITKHVSFCMRLMNKNKGVNTSLYHILPTIDKITDLIKYVSEFVKDIDSEEIYKVAGDVHSGVLLFRDYFKSNDNSKMVSFGKIRRDIKKEICSFKGQYSNGLLGNLEAILDILLDLFESVNIF